MELLGVQVDHDASVGFHERGSDSNGAAMTHFEMPDERPTSARPPRSDPGVPEFIRVE